MGLLSFECKLQKSIRINPAVHKQETTIRRRNDLITNYFNHLESKLALELNLVQLRGNKFGLKLHLRLGFILLP
jgi:hypothetical protein